jgi:hypothetical protein
MLLVGGASAQAADLGGDCCADLEERIAELEATTVRKGNRKVSLTVSGWVNEAVFFWDDGVEKNAYVGTNSLEQDRFRFVGESKITDDWSAGYTLEIGVNGAPSSGFSQAGPGSANSLSVRKSSWFVKSKSLGKVTVGQDSQSTYHLLDDADGANTRSFSDAEAAAVALGGFGTRVNGELGDTWQSVMGGFNNRTPGQGARRNVIRYDSPTFAGFSASTSWGEDDVWDLALTYKGEVGDFKLLGKVGYGASSDPSTVSGTGANCGVVGDDQDCNWWGAAGTVMHVPTGLYVYSGYGQQNNDAFEAIGRDGEYTTWFVQAGIERKWLPLGKTTVFGEYRNDQAGFTDSSFVVGGVSQGAALSSDLDFWAAGVVQNVESAAMDFYVIYRHSAGDVDTATGGKIGLDDFDMLITGAKINF